MLFRPSRGLATVALVAAALFLLRDPRAAAGTGTAVATPCNAQKAVSVGCPIPAQFCKDAKCANKLVCEGSCWELNGTYNNQFRCDAVDAFDKLQKTKWLCFQVFVLLPPPHYLTPLMMPCYDTLKCKKDMAFMCVPDPEQPDTQYHPVYGTSNDCELPS